MTFEFVLIRCLVRFCFSHSAFLMLLEDLVFNCQIWNTFFWFLCAFLQHLDKESNQHKNDQLKQILLKNERLKVLFQVRHVLINQKDPFTGVVFVVLRLTKSFDGQVFRHGQVIRQDSLAIDDVHEDQNVGEDFESFEAVLVVNVEPVIVK